MIYVEMPTADAEKLSASLYQLTRPTSVRNPADVSTHYCAWKVNANDKTMSVLELPDKDNLPIHKLADSKAVKDVFVKLNAGADIDSVIGAVDAAKESAIDATDVLPVKLKTEALTKEQAVEAGYLSASVVVKEK